jgi:hypothetical protein
LLLDRRRELEWRHVAEALRLTTGTIALVTETTFSLVIFDMRILPRSRRAASQLSDDPKKLEQGTLLFSVLVIGKRLRSSIG